MKELNLVEILKDVPSGAEFYSTVYGDCTFDRIDDDGTGYTIRIGIVNKKEVKSYAFLTSDGRTLIDFNGECALFPSKENRSWEGWEYNPLKEGDLVMAGDPNKVDWSLGKYVTENIVIVRGKRTYVQYVVPTKDFDFEDIESNANKSVI